MKAAALAIALLAGAAALPTGGASAQGWGVTPALLAASLEAPVVVRLYDTEYDVGSPGRATTRVRLVATATGPAGREAVGSLRVVHGGFRRLERFEGTLYDAAGREVRRLGRGDAEDTIPGSIYEDLRVREATLYGDAYPFTVEWTYEIDHRGVLGWPTWRPQREGWPVEEATFRLSVPAGTTVRTWTRDLVPPSVQLADGARDRYVWRIANASAFEVEPVGPPWWEQVPELRIGTDHFEIGGVAGRLDSWGTFGAWYDRLRYDRQHVPDDLRAEVERVTAGAETDLEKARRLYRYLQQTTRYVSVQLGLGGWQPFDAAYVFERRYGDCKALTNYMGALLAAAGIESAPVLIGAGEEGSDLDPDFPENAFNHVVLRVPIDEPAMRTSPLLADGAVWLECTSGYAQFGHLGAFTEGRPALLVDGNDSRVVQTPTSGPDVNWTRREAVADLDARGGADVTLRWTLHGEERADALAAFDRVTDAERGPLLRQVTGLSGLDVVEMDLGRLAERPDTLAIAARLAVPQLARRAGSRLLLSVVPFSEAVATLPAREGDRRSPVRLGTAFAARDEVRFVLPDGYAADRVPEPVEIVGPVGRYALRATAEDGALVVVRELTVDAPTQPAERYDEVRAFFAAVAEADAARAVVRQR